MTHYIMGIDIGGTHTDAALVDASGNLVSWYKATTTDPLEKGFANAIEGILAKNVDPIAICRVVVGTTHVTNAIIEATGVGRTGLIRLCGSATPQPSPCFAWPQHLKDRVLGPIQCIGGGYRCDGREMSAFCPDEAKGAIESLLASDCEAIAVVGSFSPLISDQEEQVLHLVKAIAGPTFPVSASFEIGCIGILERENATLLNAALKKFMAFSFQTLVKISKAKGIEAPLWMAQNDGTLLSLEEALHAPMQTASAGPTNSFVGGSRISERSDALVIDIGGTSTDIGIVQNGYVRRSPHGATIGGVALNFSLPDVLALAIGGGSHVIIGQEPRIGPYSVARTLRTDAQLFGGDWLTLTDIGAVLGLVDIPGTSIANVKITEQEARFVLEHVEAAVKVAINRMRGKRCDLPVVIVGGAAPLLARLGEVPTFAPVANAYGAALAEVSGAAVAIVPMATREHALEKLKQDAIDQAIAKGACQQSVRVVDVHAMPFSYTAENVVKIKVSTAGRVKGT